MKLSINESEPFSSNYQIIELPINEIEIIFSTINLCNFTESRKYAKPKKTKKTFYDANAPIITCNQTNDKNREIAGMKVSSNTELFSHIDLYLLQALNKVVSSIPSSYDKFFTIIDNKTNVKGVHSKLRRTYTQLTQNIEHIKGNYFDFAYYLDIEFKYDNKIKMNPELKNYLTKFTVRFADHVTETFDKEALSSDKIDFGNILLIDDSIYNYKTEPNTENSDEDIDNEDTDNEDEEKIIIAIEEFDEQLNQGLSLNETKYYLNIILEYRLQVQSILDYLQATKGNNLMYIKPSDLKSMLPKEYQKLIDDFDNHKMQARKLTNKDYV